VRCSTGRTLHESNQGVKRASRWDWVDTFGTLASGCLCCSALIIIHVFSRYPRLAEASHQVGVDQG